MVLPNHPGVTRSVFVCVKIVMLFPLVVLVDFPTTCVYNGELPVKVSCSQQEIQLKHWTHNSLMDS